MTKIDVFTCREQQQNNQSDGKAKTVILFQIFCEQKKNILIEVKYVLQTLLTHINAQLLKKTCKPWAK